MERDETPPTSTLKVGAKAPAFLLHRELRQRPSRAVVEALVDPDKKPYFNRHTDECVYCSGDYSSSTVWPEWVDGIKHDPDPDCPVRIVQDALKETP